MAAPQITSVVPSSAALSPGQSVNVVVTATDPDTKSGNVQFTVSDSQGNTTIASIALSLSDPITFASSNPENLPVTIERVSGTDTSATFRITAL